jgi:hypothetical protein
MVAFGLNVSVVFLVSLALSMIQNLKFDPLTLAQIGKTSSLVMTLSGVLKDILLVCASMLIFADPVSGIQAFGYTIALAGLVYYKLGSEKLKEYGSAGVRAWGEFGATRPAARRLVVIGATFLFIILLLGSASSYGIVPAHLDPVKTAGKHLGFGSSR